MEMVKTTALNSKQMIKPDTTGIYHPKNERDISELIHHAVKNNLKVRVKGAAQSVSNSIYTDDYSEAALGTLRNVNMMLDQMREVSFSNTDPLMVTVQAGCNLGFDPYDPSQISTADNGLFYKLKAKGLAIPNVPDAIHQTVGGYISTASSGGSVTHSFLDALMAIRIVDGKGDTHIFCRPESDDHNDPFFAVGVSMGLMGVIYEVTLRCIPDFNIIGKQVITDDCNAPISLFQEASDIPTLQEFLANTEFCRIIWWPFTTVKRAVIWQARTMQASDYNDETGQPSNFTPKTYQDPFYPVFLPKDIPSPLKEVIETFTELMISSIFSIIGEWPNTIKEQGNEITVFKNKVNTSELQTLVEDIWPVVFPLLLDLFIPCDGSNPPQKFWNNWVDGLAMDTNEYKNNLLAAYRTELWIPLSRAEQAMSLLESYYKNQLHRDATAANKNDANSCFVVEILGGKQNNFWLSPSYETDSIRINFYSLKQTEEDVMEYFQQFWDLFFINNINFRVHWGYYLPCPSSPEGTDYIKKQYTKWNEFMALRNTMDPHKIFVSNYWKDQLGIH